MVDVSLVEYTQGRVYYVRLQENNNAIFCKSAIGKLKDGIFIHKTCVKSFQFNKNDIQKINQKFIIKQFQASCENCSLLIDQSSTTIEDQMCAINDYFNI